LNVVLWILGGGTQWRLMPVSLDIWNSVFKRFSRWSERGVWESVYKGCIQHPDLLLIDSMIGCAHACAAVAAGSDAETEALGWSKVGFTTKIHDGMDGLGSVDISIIGIQKQSVTNIRQNNNLLI